MSGIGYRIKERRISLGLSQEELAKRLGYKSRSSINKIEVGINDITQSKIEQFAKALDTTPAYLMGLDRVKIEFALSVHEKEIIKRYRNSTPEMQAAIDIILGINTSNKYEDTTEIWAAARSRDGNDKFVRRKVNKKAVEEAIKNTPESDDDL